MHARWVRNGLLLASLWLASCAGGGTGAPPPPSGTGGAGTDGGAGAGGARGGQGGSSGPDAGTDAGDASHAGSPCAARAGLIFCDDFESTAIGSTPSGAWSAAINGAGTVKVDDSVPAHSGARSLHIQSGDQDYDTLLALHDPTVLPAANGRFYVRAYMRLGGPMSAMHNSFILADMFAKPGQGNNVRVGEDAAMLMETVAGDAHGALSNSNYYNDGKPGIVFAPDTWVCLELLLDAGPPSEIDVWVDGVEVPALHHTDWTLDRYDNVRFGFEKYAGPALELWYDDIAVGSQRIGCD
jgi:hypothetical protein